MRQQLLERRRQFNVVSANKSSIGVIEARIAKTL